MQGNAGEYQRGVLHSAGERVEPGEGDLLSVSVHLNVHFRSAPDTNKWHGVQIRIHNGFIATGGPGPGL